MNIPPARWRIWLSLAPLLAKSAAQFRFGTPDCYYPNGDLSSDWPCSTDGGTCCPLNWECLSNGLCYLENEDYFERNTCTDQSWGAGCPGFCTQNYTAPGNEAIQLCDLDDDTSWCCDGDRVSLDCCSMQKEDDRFFSLAQGTVTASISSRSSQLGSGSTFGASTSPSEDETSTSTSSFTSSSSDRATATSTSSKSEDSTTSSSSESLGSTSSSSTISLAPIPWPTTSKVSTALLTSVTSDAAGEVSTQVITSVLTTTPTHSTSPVAAVQSSHNSSLPTILATSIAIPLVLLAAAFLAFLLWRRRRDRRRNDSKLNPFRNPATDHHNSNEKSYSTLYPSPSEIDSYPVAAPHTAELDNISPRSLQQPSSSISPMTTGNNRWSAVSSMPGPGEGYNTQSYQYPHAGLGQQEQQYPYAQHSPPMPQVSEEAGLGQYKPYRPYRPTYELAGTEVQPTLPDVDLPRQPEHSGVKETRKESSSETERKREEMRKEGLFPDLGVHEGT